MGYEDLNLITLDERLKMPFKIMGSQNLKVIDLDKATVEMMQKRLKEDLPNIVEVKAIRIDRYKELMKGLTYSRDPKTGIFYGLPAGTFPDGNIKWNRIILTEHNTFNLENDTEQKMWCVLRMHPTIKGSPLQLEDPIFEMVDPEIESRKRLRSANVMLEAMTLAKEIAPENLLRFARYLGIQVPAVPTVSQLQSLIMLFAQNSPFDFMNYYHDKNRGIIELFKMGTAIGVIRNEIDRGFVFEGIYLGLTEPEVVRFLEQDTVLLARIQKDVKAKDHESDLLTTEIESKKPAKAK